MNIAIHAFVGRFPRDPHIIPSVGKNGTKLALFRILNNDVYIDPTTGEKKTITTAYPCSAWGKMADLIEKFCRKGKEVGIKADFRTNYEKGENGQPGKEHMTFRVREIDFGRNSLANRDLAQAANASAEVTSNPQVPTDPAAQLQLLAQLTELAKNAGIMK